MLKDFKKFIMTGNVIDLAIAVILAGAVGLVVKGFVSLVMMPIIGHFAGGVDFADLKVILDEAVLDAEGAILTSQGLSLQELANKHSQQQDRRLYPERCTITNGK